MGWIRWIHNWVDRICRGPFYTICLAIRRFNEAQASQAAAAMAYYALFSLFPLLLVLIALGSFALEKQSAQQQLLSTVTNMIPNSRDLIQQNIQQVLERRGSFGIVGLIGLLWSSSGFFSNLASNINRAWLGTFGRNFLKRRLVGLGIVLSLTVLLTVSVVASAILNILAQLSVPLGGSISLYDTAFWKIGSNLLPFLLRMLILMGLYRWVPSLRVEWSDVVLGAVVAALGWDLATRGFTWYVSSGWATYELVYGSLGTVVALLFWIYLVSLVTLFGAHLSAAMAQHGRQLEKWAVR